MDISFLKEQANRCRSLAEKADPFIMKRLLDLAATYDARLGVASRGSRTLLEVRMQPPPEAGVEHNR